MEEKKALNIWIIKEGEALPIRENARRMRMGMLAEYLSAKGHTVTWWASTYIHAEKAYFSGRSRMIKVNRKLRLVLLHAPIVYKKNRSLLRLVYIEILARMFRKQSTKLQEPDIILCAWPTPQFAREAVIYGRKHRVPVVIDVRDLWPDIFVRALPGRLRAIGDLLLKPMKRSAARTFRKADGITGMVDAALEWGCRYARREPGAWDRVIYIGNEREVLTDEEYQESLSWWFERGVAESDWIICFFSTFGSHLSLDTVIKAVKVLSDTCPDLRLVLGGAGDREKEFKDLAGDCPNIRFAGWLDNKKMTSLMRIAKCGAFCIRNTMDFRDTFNNKAIQYISEGLPVLNSLSGFAKTLIAEWDMGLTYACENVADCADKILMLYHDEKRRAQMGQNALQCFSEMFDSGIVNEQFEEYLIRMVQKYKRELESKI